MDKCYNRIVILIFTTLYIAEVSADITVCIPLDKIKNNGNEDNYSSVIRTLKLKLASSLEDDNSTKYYDHLEFNFKHPALSAEGELNKVYVRNLNEFSLKYFQNIDIIHNTMELFNLTFHNISVIGEYNLTGNIGDLFDIFGEGDFWLNLLNLSVFATSGFPSINETAACITMDITPKLEKVEGWFYKLMNDEDLEEVVNKAVAEIVPEAVDVIWLEFKDVLDESLEELINSIVIGDSSILSKMRGIQDNTSLRDIELNKIF